MSGLVPAYYAQYREGHFGARDRIGGLPSHLPSSYPTCPDCGRKLAFIMQLYVDEMALFPDDWLALHLYGCTREGCIESRLIAVDRDSVTNDSGIGIAHPYAQPRDISWLRRNDPDPRLYADDIDPFWESEALAEKYPHIQDDKLGGCFAWCDDGATTGYRLGAIGQFQNPICSPTNQCGMIYLYNASARGLYFDYY